MNLFQALGIEGGIVCAVGAGGKKSLLHALASIHDPASGRLAMTATARCTPPPEGLFQACFAAEGDALAALVARSNAERVFYAGPERKPGRHEGVDPDTVRALHREQGFALTLVKADGARMRWIKAPAEDEPALVPDCDLVVPVLSLRALGRPLDERSAHRPERVAALTGLALGAAITEPALAALLAHEEGSVRGSEGRRVVPLLNMVDDEAALGAAMAIAQEALSRSDRFDRVVLARLRDPGDPRIWVCRR
jgi:probable selenium-dependent hydroxylase accessory protein YqeC